MVKLCGNKRLRDLQKVCERKYKLLTTCVFGVCVDTWDCTKEKVDCFWVKS